jgi:hypothetical protein
MYAENTMTKDQTFKLRLDEEDRARLESVAKHYSARAATAIRWLIKEKFDAIEAEKVTTLGREHHDVMWCFSGGSERVSRGDVARAMNRVGYDAKWTGLGRALNGLRAEGYIKRVSQRAEESEMDRSVGNYHGSIYVLTPKGSAYVQANWKK